MAYRLSVPVFAAQLFGNPDHRRDMAMFAYRHSDGIDQFNEVMGTMRSAFAFIELGQNGCGEDRFMTRDMIEAEQRLHHAADMMADQVKIRTCTVNHLAGTWLFYKQTSALKSPHGLFERPE